MNVHLGKKYTQEEANRMAELEEKEAERRNRREHYYKNDANNNHYKRRPHIFLFRSEDLDNEDVIYAVESTPTYKRTRKTLEDIRTAANGLKAEETETKDNDTAQGIISFA